MTLEDTKDGATEKEDKKITLEEILKKLVNLEQGRNFTKAKDIISRRTNARIYIKTLLEQKNQLPENSEYFAGIVATEGRIGWKEVAYELMEKYKIPEEEFFNLVKEYQPKSHKIVYGKQDEQFQQLKFEFITPKTSE